MTRVENVSVNNRVAFCFWIRLLSLLLLLMEGKSDRTSDRQGKVQSAGGSESTLRFN